jgi:membrane protease YdiL (CAAX protease family)
MDTRIRAISDLLILTGLCLIGMLVFSGIGLVLIPMITGVKPLDMASFMQGEGEVPGMRMSMLLLQGLISCGSFILLPYLIRFFRPDSDAPEILKPTATLLILITGLAILMMPVNAWLAAWNQRIHLPGFLQGFQSWAMAKELEMEKITGFLVNFSNAKEMITGILVISVVAGMTEEFFFRKMIQPRMILLSGNPHLGIWITAFIFSAIHVQLYGLIPRMALGALFGYYFYWTGNIALPMLAHALNNGITLLGLILYQQKVSPINVENPDAIPWYLGAISAGLVWSLSSMLREEALKIRRISNQQGKQS